MRNKGGIKKKKHTHIHTHTHTYIHTDGSNNGNQIRTCHTRAEKIVSVNGSVDLTKGKTGKF